ncbi:MAG: hypothetical protein ACPGWS_09145 [Solirubrobacterales bacterium]
MIAGVRSYTLRRAGRSSSVLRGLTMSDVLITVAESSDSIDDLWEVRVRLDDGPEHALVEGQPAITLIQLLDVVNRGAPSAYSR